MRFGLYSRYARKPLKDFVDFDYLGKLTDAELDWLNKFSREHYKAQFTPDDTNLNQDPEDKRLRYGENNARNRDMWNKFDRILDDASNATNENEIAEEEDK